MLQPVFICTHCLPANAYAMPTNTLSFFRFRNVPPATKAGRTAALAHLKHLTWSLNAERRRCAPRHARPLQGIYLLKYLLAEQILIQNYHISLYSNAFNPNVRRRSICAPPNKLWQMFTLSMTSEWECVCTNARSYVSHLPAIVQIFIFVHEQRLAIRGFGLPSKPIADDCRGLLLESSLVESKDNLFKK